MSARNFPLVVDRIRVIETRRGPLPEAQRAAALVVGRSAEAHGEAWVAAEPDGTLIVGACEAVAVARAMGREQRTTAVTLVAPDGTTRRAE